MNYFGYKYDEVENMDSETFFHLCKSMEKALAIEKIESMEVSAFPHMSKSEMKKLHKRIYKISRVESEEVKNVVKLGDLARVLGNG